MHMSNIYYYSSGSLFFNKQQYLENFINHNNGLELYEKLFYVFAINLGFHDRSETIKTPFNTLTIPEFKIPTGKCDKSFEDICNERARDLLAFAEQTDRKLLIMYSGGIDSTLILTSILKNSTKQQQKLVHLLLNEASVYENKLFFENFVQDSFSYSNSYLFKHFLGDPKYIIVTGEGNDQLFGSQVLVDNIDHFGNTPWNIKINNNHIIDFFNKKIKDKNVSEKLFYILNNVCTNAPIDIDTPYKWFWWINFTCKWQSVFLRLASFIDENKSNSLKPMDNFLMFYGTKDFQLWSINNSNNLIDRSFKNYKQICKDIIYRFDKNDEYRQNKTKVGSLSGILYKKPTALAVDSNYKIIYNLKGHNIINNNNDFIQPS